MEGLAGTLGRFAGPLAVVVLSLLAVALGGQLSRYELDLAVTLLSYVVLAQAWNAVWDTTWP